MERIDELKSKLRQKRQEYQSLRSDYEILKQNVKANVDAKKDMRKEIDTLNKEYQELKKHAEKKEVQKPDTATPEAEQDLDI